ncbi:unnamed protein product [Bursaphelenchus xylophilus]|uniref:(pine wood nematode) hypothetical protein n=1 Tax=Bursaphelenchus xylophilus TaxID=6326 RepID=A0A1I7RIU5_BURXY|nr:unnamed protein product [Bursaphelenchus xylophilus]CAG9119100.1 unnamed protein product [Bursaphelenchus xylophilus]
MNVRFWTGMVNVAGTTVTMYSMASSAFFIFIVTKASSIHGNLRFLLILVSFELRLLAIPRLLTDAFQSLVGEGLVTETVCTSMSFVHAFGMGLVQFSFATVIIERAIATKYHKSYDNWDTTLTRVLVALLVIYAFGYALAVFVLSGFGLVEEHFSDCVLMNRFPVFYVYSWFIFGLNMAFGAGPTIYLYHYNKKMSLRRGEGTLTTRYQYHDNVVVLRIFTPLIVVGVFGVGFLCIVIVGTVGMKMVHGEKLDEQMYLFLKTTFVMTDCCAAAYEAAFLRYHPVLYCSTRRYLPCVRRTRPKTENSLSARPVEEGEEYFKQLNKVWG